MGWVTFQLSHVMSVLPLRTNLKHAEKRSSCTLQARAQDSFNTEQRISDKVTCSVKFEMHGTERTEFENTFQRFANATFKDQLTWGQSRHFVFLMTKRVIWLEIDHILFKMAASGTLVDVSEVLGPSIVILVMEAAGTSEMLDSFYKTARRITEKN